MSKNQIFPFRRSIPNDHPLTLIRYFLFGHPLKSSVQNRERLGFYLGLPLLAVDALSSVAYATEEILIALSVMGTSLYGFAIPISFAIIVLLVTLVGSYVQTVQAYPEGGGAYVIAHNHLGSFASLIAASCLLIDYTLTVAVSVTAGVRALSSSYPFLLNHKVTLSVTSILLLGWLNLRGIRESAKFVSPFVYIFIGVIFLLGIDSLWLTPVIETVPASLSLEKLPLKSLLDLAIIPIILRAFASGCTAMTGIEAIANAGSMLKRPHSLIAQKILISLGFLLGIMFLLMTFSALKLGLIPFENESLISQMSRKVWGNGIIHQIIQILTASILFLAANTAFAGAPKLSAMLAQDGWLPKQLHVIGDRLVFSKGIIVLACVASALVILFRGQTHALIPLYAIGVFSAFTLSQAGMVRYWRHSSKSVSAWLSPRIKSWINGIGAGLTGLALIVTCEAKFMEGAFLILMILPLMILVCLWIQSHYKATTALLDISPDQLNICQTHLPKLQKQAVIVPVSRLHRGALAAIRFAREISQDVKIVMVEIDHDKTLKVKNDIENLNWDLQVITLSSPYRSIIQPIVDYVHKVDQENNKAAIVVLPEIVPVHWWQNILHNKTSKNILNALAWSDVLQSQSRIIINVPYYLKKS